MNSYGINHNFFTPNTTTMPFYALATVSISSKTTKLLQSGSPASFHLFRALIGLLTVTVFFGCCDDDAAMPDGQLALSSWAGTYTTLAERNADALSPLTIDEDGFLRIAGVEISDYSFSNSNRQLNFGPVLINDQTITATLNFQADGPVAYFDGSYTTPLESNLGYRGADEPLVLWAGSFTTVTSSWGAFFFPLVVSTDGQLTVGGETIEEVTYDHASRALSWPLQDIKTTRATAEITFTEAEWGAATFSGRIRPRPQDGWVSYSGAME